MPHPEDVLVVVAAAGYGKSAALEAARPRGGVVRPAAALLEDGLPDCDWLGVDDLDALTVSEQVRLLEDVARRPGPPRLGLASRQPLPAAAGARLRGRVRELGACDLALSTYGVRRVVVEEYGLDDPELPVTVHALTAGWPALVHHAAAAARRPSAELADVLAEDRSLQRWLHAEVVTRLPRGVAAALGAVSGLGGVTPGVVEHVAAELGVGRAPVARDLERLGLLVRLPGTGREDLVDAVPLLAPVLPARDGPTAACVVGPALAADLPYAAARAAAGAGDVTSALRLVAERGEEMLRSAHHAGVVELVEAAPDPLVTPAVRRVHGDALRAAGELAAAARAFRPLAGDEGPWEPRLARKVAAMHYAGGRFDAVLEALGRGRAQRDLDATGLVESLALQVHALCSLGRPEEAAGPAERALALAEAGGDPVAGAAAHLAMARCRTGAVKEAHHERALVAAAQGRDVITAARVLVNQAFHLLASARYDEACEVARAALHAADAGNPTGRRAAALHNLAEALTYTGAYDEARWHLARAVGLCRRLGAGRTALGVLGLAEIDRAVGQDDQARPRYLEAVALARTTGEAQVLVPALAGLARVDARAGSAELRERARTSAAEAVALARGVLRPVALVAAGRVALADGERGRAGDLARDAAATARDAEALDLLAEALELAAACATEPDEARDLLTRAYAVWSAGGARPRAARVELALGVLPGADPVARSRARDARRELRRLGVVHVDGVPAPATTPAGCLEIDVLGGFRVRVDGADVPVTAWRSRQARTLVKVLASRRGRPATRAWLCETLWPDDDPARTGHRLSVLLTAVRGVLDPGRRWPSDHFVAGDLDGLRLVADRVRVDAEVLIEDATAAAALMDDGDEQRAREILGDVDRRYAGDAFEDEPAEEWADALREEARAAWQRSVRRLSVLAQRAGRPSDAQALLVRLLTADPYDEAAHRQLVRTLLRAGRRGEARRAFGRWERAMADLGAPPPDPRVLVTARPDRPRRARPPATVTRGRPVVTSY
ncbi:BTAD domain-containing putative transcriptional regulator [Nocardioides sp. TF02-7]|uniref:BTAD domain-containing putative transcriptional regulator n=1 Tax=Nocardioides sp. TF02-7 TaxID=2917724 RepID=UPI001F059771|nr:BTAD domain-containing putative transcriptional regulator [Nocardioides sp. TF02-7]UMG91920.1 hypothetical protein MF408_18130 [Nocardioides sp. TF02-7]